MNWFGVSGEGAHGSDDENVIGNYTLGNVLGQGTFGLVRQGKHNTTGQRVAIKIIDAQKMDREALDRETKNQLCLQHANIVKIFEIIEKRNTTFIVMELVQNELFDYLVEQGRLKESAAKKVFSQIVAAVEHCHDSMVVHRDLKPENILLDNDKNVKLADFGLSAQWRKDEFLTDSCGSPNYAAPELLHKNCQYEGPEIDVWSCGVILYVLLTNNLPFDEDSIPKLFRVIKKGHYKMPGYFSADAKDLLKGMLEVDRSKRLTIAQVRNHCWLASERGPAVDLAPTPGVAPKADTNPSPAATVRSTAVLGANATALKSVSQSAQQLIRVLSAVGSIAQA